MKKVFISENAAILVISVLILLAPSIPLAADNAIDAITYMTEQYPPFNFEENHEIKGISVDILESILKRSGSSKTKKDFEMTPWARGYKLVQATDNTCLFAMARTPEREDKFKWVGPFASSKVSLTALNTSNIIINDPAEAAKYHIGVIRDDVAHLILKKMNIPDDSIFINSNTQSNIKMLLKNRIDMWAYGEEVAKWEFKSNGYDPENLKTIYVLSEEPIYFGFNKNVPDTVIGTLQKELDKLKKEDLYQKILDKYLK